MSNAKKNAPKTDDKKKDNAGKVAEVLGAKKNDVKTGTVNPDKVTQADAKAQAGTDKAPDVKPEEGIVKAPPEIATTTTAKFGGSRNAIRSTLRRHEEFAEVDANNFTEVKSGQSVILGPDIIDIKGPDGKGSGKVPYGKAQYNKTAALLNANGGAAVIRGGGGGNATSNVVSPGTVAMKSLQNVLRNNGFESNKEAKDATVMDNGDFNITLDDKGWELKKKTKSVKKGQYGRGTMKAIKDSMAVKAA